MQGPLAAAASSPFLLHRSADADPVLLRAGIFLSSGTRLRHTARRFSFPLREAQETDGAARNPQDAFSCGEEKILLLLLRERLHGPVFPSPASVFHPEIRRDPFRRIFTDHPVFQVRSGTGKITPCLRNQASIRRPSPPCRAGRPRSRESCRDLSSRDPLYLRSSFFHPGCPSGSPLIRRRLPAVPRMPGLSSLCFRSISHKVISPAAEEAPFCFSLSLRAAAAIRGMQGSACFPSGTGSCSGRQQRQVLCLSPSEPGPAARPLPFQGPSSFRGMPAGGVLFFQFLLPPAAVLSCLLYSRQDRRA